MEKHVRAAERSSFLPLQQRLPEEEGTSAYQQRNSYFLWSLEHTAQISNSFVFLLLFFFQTYRGYKDFFSKLEYRPLKPLCVRHKSWHKTLIAGIYVFILKMFYNLLCIKIFT